VLIAVDDLQWLDEPSGQTLAFALRRLIGEPVVLVAAVRTETGGGVPFELDRALGEGHLRRLRLGPLSLGSVHELLRITLGLNLSRAVLDPVHESSGGNPFLALEMGRELARGGVEPSVHELLPMPDDLRALLRDRLRCLPEWVRGLLLAVAALPRPTIDVLEAVHGGSVLDDLDEAARSDIVELEGDRVRFSHPLLASVCYADAPRVRRRAVHARASNSVTDPEERARHPALASEGVDEAVATALEEAAAHASVRGAPQAAADLWELASARSSSSDATRRRLLAAADARIRAADFAGAGALLQRLLGGAGSGLERAELLVRLSVTRRDDFVEAGDLCERALAEAGGDARIGALVHRYLSWNRFMGGDVNQALLHARRALDLGASVVGADLAVLIAGHAAWVEALAGQVTPGLLERALDLEQTATNVSAHEAPTRVLACCLMYRDRIAEARPLFERLLATATDAGDEFAMVGVLLQLIQLECRGGSLDRADGLAAEIVELCERRGLEQHGSAALYCRALVDAHLGRDDLSRAAAEEGIAIARAIGDGIFELANLGVLGFLDLSLGNLDRAIVSLRPLPDRLVSLGWYEPSVLPIWPNAIEALVGLGEIGEARRHLALYEPAVGGVSQPVGARHRWSRPRPGRGSRRRPGRRATSRAPRAGRARADGTIRAGTNAARPRVHRASRQTEAVCTRCARGGPGRLRGTRCPALGGPGERRAGQGRRPTARLGRAHRRGAAGRRAGRRGTDQPGGRGGPVRERAHGRLATARRLPKLGVRSRTQLARRLAELAGDG
jgi:hypothetical protein